MDAKRRGPVPRLVSLTLGVGLLTLACGCNFYRKVIGEGEDAETDRSASAQAQTYYTARDGVKLYDEPRFGKTVLSTLPLHQKVYRYKQENGFAYVKVDRSGQMGWVENSLLIWKLPAKAARPPAAPVVDSAPAPAVAPEAEVEDSQPASAVAPQAPADVPVQQREVAPPPPDADAVNPSHFDPF